MIIPKSSSAYGKTESPFASQHSTDLFSVKWENGFWKDRFEQCRKTTIPHLKKSFEDPRGTGCIHNFEVKAGIKKGDFYGTEWQDEFLYKWMEAQCYIYTQTGDQEILQELDPIISLIGKAQDKDGYIATQILRYKERFLSPHHHELYVMGHMITAACAHKLATGQNNFLDIAVKCADFLHAFFMPKNLRYAHFGINPSYIMACVDLYRITGAQKYLDLANCFIDMRGSAPRSRMRQAGDLNDQGSINIRQGIFLEDLPEADRPIPPTNHDGAGGGDLNQTRIPLRQETEVAGHSVFWSYLYAGAADAFMETGDVSLKKSLQKLWEDVAFTKLYITGGAAAVHRGFHVRDGENPWTADQVHEAVGHRYDLPGFSAYNETCAQIGNFMWNYRMLLLNGEVKYADIMENTIYNSIISGIGIEGKSWFYTNPLRWFGRDHKLLSQDAYERFQPGEKHICCPSNLLRTVAGMHNFMYTQTSSGLAVNMYGSSRFEGTFTGGGSIILRQETNYPWHGKIIFYIEKAGKEKLSLQLRIPEWAEGATLAVNGKKITKNLKPVSYAGLSRIWKTGDTVTLNLPFKPRLLTAHPYVESAVNQAAVACGPIIYCLESPDLPKNTDISQVHIPRNAKFTVKYEPQLLGGINILETIALISGKTNWKGKLYQETKNFSMKKQKIRLIPYFVWANRGISKMSVWLPLG